mgnify:CR=1 FL=1
MTFMIGENMVGGYGSTDILNGCSICVDLGEIAVVVGPNGAGKTTLFNVIAGVLSKFLFQLQFIVTIHLDSSVDSHWDLNANSAKSLYPELGMTFVNV